MTKADRQWILDVFIFCTLHLFELLRINLWFLKINCYFMMYIGVFISKILNAGKTKCNLHWKETEWILVQSKLFANSYPDSIIRTLLCRWPVVTSLAIHLGYIFCLLGPFWLIQYTSITQSLWVKVVQWPQTRYLDLIMSLRSL